MKTNIHPQPCTIYMVVFTLLILLYWSLSAQAQTTIFSENFEGNTTSWSFINTSGNGQNLWEVSDNTCGYTGNKLTVRRNNDVCTYRNNSAHNIMARRQITSTGYQNLTLAFDWIGNGEANYDYGSLYYSFNGTTWTQITAGGNSGIYQGTTAWGAQTAFSLPSILDNTTFYLGFNWVNDNSSGSYPAFGVDNIVIKGSIIPVAPPQPPSNTIFSQNFSSGALPTGWTNTDMTGNSAGTWSFNNPGARTINTTTAANGFAIFDSDKIGQDNKVENGELVTVAFNCASYSTVNLSLSHYFRFYANSNYRISVSGDNGATYTTLVFDSTETANAAIYAVDISPYAAGKSQVKLKFTYKGNYSWYWAVDDILVTGQQSSTATWTGAVSTSWTTTGNWSGGAVPTTATTVTIPTGAIRMPTVAAGAGAGVANLTVASGATLTVASDSMQGGNLTIAGSLVCSGAIVYTGNAMIKLAGAGKQISGNFAGGASNVVWQIQNGGSYTLNGNFTTYGIKIATGGMLSLSGYTLSTYIFQQMGGLSLGSGTLEIAGSNPILTETGFSRGTGTLSFNSGGTTWSSKPTVNQIIPSVSYYDLQVRSNNGYTITLGTTGALYVARDLTILNPGIAGGIVSTGADISILGNFTLGSAITNGLTFNIAHRVVGGGLSSSLIFAGNTSSCQVNISYTNSSLAAIDNFDGISTVVNYPIAFTGLGTQMISPLDYTSLSISGIGTKALGADVVINGNITIGAGTLTTAISMVTEKVSASPAVDVSYVNGGLAALNAAPTLASLMGSASSMSINIPLAYANRSMSGLKINIPHTYNSDLDIYLVSPNGTVYVLSTDNGGSGDGYIDAVFNDGGVVVPTTNVLLNGTYKPEGFTFASITGAINGTWTLYAVDDADQDNGTITGFSLQLGSASPYANLDIKGNWLNTNGIFTAGNALVTFSGNSQQNISTNGQSFYQMAVNNGAGVTLNQDLTVTNTLTLTNGIITTGANRLIMTNTATGNLAAYSANAFINGNLRRYIGFNTQTYMFPVGNGTTSANYRLAELQNNLLLGVSYLDVYFKALSNHNNSDLNITEGGLDIQSVHNNGVWVIEPNAQPTLGTYAIKLYLTGFSGLIDNEFVILKRPLGSLSAASWSTGNGLLSLVNGLGRLLSGGFALRTGLTSFSEFGIGSGSSGGSSLPIELMDFTAKVTDDAQIRLDWATAVEIDNDYFTVERSAGGIEFEPVSIINGAGNSSHMHTYHTFDQTPLPGLSYYRLMQTDFNGSVTYSPIRSVVIAKAKDAVTLNVYPNPSSGQFSVNIKGMEGAANVLVTDMQGRVVYNADVGLDGADDHVSLELTNNLQPGLYQLQLIGAGQSVAHKLIVQ